MTIDPMVQSAVGMQCKFVAMSVATNSNNEWSSDTVRVEVRKYLQKVIFP